MDNSNFIFAALFMESHFRRTCVCQHMNKMLVQYHTLNGAIFIFLYFIQHVRDQHHNEATTNEQAEVE